MAVHTFRIRVLLFAGLLAVGGLAWGPGLVAAENPGSVPADSGTLVALTDQAIALLSQSRAAEWIGPLTEELARLAFGAPVPVGTYDLVLAAVGAGALPDDPRQAAGDLHAAARAADRAWRRGVAAVVLRAEIRAAWQARRVSGDGISLRPGKRAENAMEDFAAGNRRSWDPTFLGRDGADGDPAGSGPGGRW
jgi:hypothetical protein